MADGATLSVKVQRRPGAGATVALSGHLDAHTFVWLDTAFGELTRTRVKYVVFDLSGLDYLSSIGVNFFLSVRASLHASGGDAALAAPRPHILKVLQTLGLTAILHLTATRDEAWALLKPSKA
jgi:anti-anti-sigma factor